MTTPRIDLETTVTRDQPVTETTGSIQVSTDELDDDTITLSFGGPWGITYVDLTVEEAHAVATALEAAATTAQEGPTDE